MSLRGVTLQINVPLCEDGNDVSGFGFVLSIVPVRWRCKSFSAEMKFKDDAFLYK
jgi:hypothetical protein